MNMLRNAIVLILSMHSIALIGQFQVNGAIIDKITSTPIIGATVVIKNTNKGTTTDFDGNFSLANVPEDAVLVFSYLGYISQEVEVTNEKLTIYLEPSISELSEVVLVGYGSQAKKEVTGAVAVLGSNEIEKLNLLELSKLFKVK